MIVEYRRLALSLGFGVDGLCNYFVCSTVGTFSRKLVTGPSEKKSLLKKGKCRRRRPVVHVVFKAAILTALCWSYVRRTGGGSQLACCWVLVAGKCTQLWIVVSFSLSRMVSFVFPVPCRGQVRVRCTLTSSAFPSSSSHALRQSAIYSCCVLDPRKFRRFT